MTDPVTEVFDDARDPDRPVHGWFGLTRASYLVLPRSVLQAMPAAWQARFVAALGELEAALGDAYGANEYRVRLLDENGRGVDDPLANYRHPPALTPKEGPK